MKGFETLVALLCLVMAWCWVVFTTMDLWLCQGTTFGGVWSSIVIDDCTGRFVAPTYSEYLGVEEGLVTPYWVYKPSTTSEVQHED